MSMVTIRFFDPQTGLFSPRCWSGPSRRSGSVVAPAGMVALDVTSIAGFDWQAMRVDLATGQVVDYQPPAPPDTEHETFAWDASIKRWVGTPTAAAHWQLVRAERDRRLSACDWVVARASERGEPVPIDWTVYRQALRDITDQPDPLAIRWPEPPA